MLLFGSGSMNATVQAVYQAPPDHDRAGKKYAEKTVAKESDPIAQALNRDEVLLLVAHDSSLAGGNVVAVTDQRSFVVKRGKVRKELQHYEVAETKLYSTPLNKMLVEIISRSALQDFGPNDPMRYTKIVQVEVATPRIGNSICGHIDRIIGAA